MDIKILRERYHYDPDTGVVTRKEGWNKRWAGSSNFKIGNHGYRVVQILGKEYLLHRVIWYYMTGGWPKGQIDHINRDRLDNSWKNLRDVESIDNVKNTGITSNNSSGCTGVSFHKILNKWRAYIGVDYKQVHLGFFDTKEEAVQARKQASEKYNFPVSVNPQISKVMA